MSTSNNSAARLLNLIKTGKAIDRNLFIHEAWSKLLSIPKDDKSLLFKRLGKTISLTLEVRKDIEALSISKEDIALYLRWWGPVHSAFHGTTLEMKWDQFLNRLKDDTILSLEFCASTLSKEKPEKTIEKEKIQSILKEIDNLIDEIENTDLEQPLQNYLLEHLRNIKNALEEYKICGIAAIESRINEIIGSAFTNKIEIKKQRHPVCKKFRRIVTDISIIITLVTGVPQLTDNVSNFFQSNQPVVEKGIQQNGSDTEQEIINIDSSCKILDV